MLKLLCLLVLIPVAGCTKPDPKPVEEIPEIPIFVDPADDEPRGEYSIAAADREDVRIKFNEKYFPYTYALGVTWDGKYQGIVTIEDYIYLPWVESGSTVMELVHYDMEGRKTGKRNRFTVRMPKR